MIKQNAIITDCVCDLTNEFLVENEIEVVRFYLTLDSGRFMDGYEISLSNVVEYYEEMETKIISAPPSAEEYAQIYKKALADKSAVVHFTISSLISDSYRTAMAGRELLKEDANRVFIIDTRTLSSGMGFLLLNACEMNQKGLSAQEIVRASSKMIPKINVSFVTKNADYLEINERVSPAVARIFRTVRFHPVFVIKEGRLAVGGMEHGAKAGYTKRYIRHRIRHPEKIDKSRVFITHAGCNKEDVDRIVSEVKSICNFENVHITKTSATVTCNCGGGTFGVMFMYK